MVEDFYGTGIEIWVGFGLIDCTEKRVWADYEQLFKVNFHVFRGKNVNFLKNIVVSALKSCIVSLL